MTSHLGTLGPQSYPYSFDNTSQNFCGGDPRPGKNPCCPEFTKNIKPANIGSFFTESSHGLGQPYTMTFDSSGPFSNAMEASLKAWADWLRADGCPSVTGFKFDYHLYNTNSSVKPTGSAVLGSYTSGPVQTVVYVNGIVSPATFVWNIPASPNWWFVKVTATPVGRNGQAVTCAKSNDCFDGFYTGWIDDAVNALRVAPGSAGAAAGTNAPAKVRFIE